MNYQKTALAALLSAPLALLVIRPATSQAQTMELVLGCIFIGTCCGEIQSEGSGFRISSLMPSIAGGIFGVLTLAFLAFAYDHSASSTPPTLPFISDGALSFNRNPILLTMLAIYGVAQVVAISAAIIAREPIVQIIAQLREINPSKIRNWFIALTGATAAIFAFVKML